MLPVLFLVTPRDGTVYQEHAQGSETVRTRWSEIGLCTLGKVGSRRLPSAPPSPCGLVLVTLDN